jgi:hypothetical protein
MGMLSWLFPTQEDRLKKARRLMERGKYEDARRGLLHCTHPEAEALYDACSKEVEKAEVVTLKKRARANGFRGWRVEISTRDARSKTQLEAFCTRELAKAGIDLETPELDEEAVKAVLAKVHQKASNKGVAGTVKLVPIIAEQARPAR